MTDQQGHSTSGASASTVVRSWGMAWPLAALTPLLSLFIIRPWRPGAFPVYDFCDLLPVFRSHHGFADTFRALASVDRPNGLARYVLYAQLTAHWLIAGDNPVAWQWLRALMMLVAAVLIVLAARKLGATPLAAAMGALLFTIGVPSTEGWLFLMAEPFGLVLLLCFLLVAAGYRTTTAWKRDAVLLAAIAFMVMNTKEVFSVCLPALVIFAVTWSRDGFRRPALTARELWLAVVLSVALALQLWMMRSALHAAPPGAYAAGFGRDGFSPGYFSTRFQAMLLPDRYSSASASTVLYPGNLAFLLVLLMGLARPERSTGRGRNWGWYGALMFSFPVVGALTYALWPRYSAFYGIPFFAGSIGLFILAAAAAERGHRLGRTVVAAVGAAAILYTAIPSWRTVNDKHAVAALALAVSKSLGAAPPLDTLYVVAPAAGGRRWPVTGSELRRYAVAMGVTDAALPVVRDASCEEVGARLRQPLGRSAVLNDINPCGRLGAHSRVWLSEVPYRDWYTMRRKVDTVLVEILAPSWAASGPRP